MISRLKSHFISDDKSKFD